MVKNKDKINEGSTMDGLSKSRHIFLTGEIQVGKSTLLRKIRRELCQKYHLTEAGFETRPYEINGRCKGFYLHGLVPMQRYDNDCPINIRLGGGKMVFVTESFETAGTEILENSIRQAKRQPTLLVLDEIGKSERSASGFQAKVFRCLDEIPYVVGVLRQGEHSFPQSIAQRPDVEVYTVTLKNRDTLFEKGLVPL